MNLQKHGVREQVYALKNTTQEVLERRLLPDGVKFSFVFIDGLHTPSGVQTDFLLSFPRLIYDRIMVFDAYYEEGVKDYAKLIDILTSTEGMQLVMEPSSRLVWFIKSRPSQEK